MTWSNAKQACIDYGGQLLAEVDDSLKAEIAMAVEEYGDDDVWWISLAKKVDQYWTWATGDTIGKNMMWLLKITLHCA